jgi:PAS domain S-box-containing protein
MDMNCSNLKKATNEVSDFELEILRARNAALVSAIPDLVFVNNSDLVYQDVVFENAEDLALPPKSLIGKSIYDLDISRGLKNLFAKSITAAINQKTRQRIRYKMRTIKGEVEHFEARIVPYRDNEALTLVRNITKEIVSEYRRRGSYSELKFVNGFLKASTNVTMSISSILDFDKLIVEIVKQVQKQFDLYWVGMFIKEDKGGKTCLRLKYSADKNKSTSPRNFCLSAQEKYLVSQAYETGKIEFVNYGVDGTKYLKFTFLPDTQIEMALPIFIEQKKFGVLSLQCEKKSRFSGEILDVFKILGSQINSVLSNAYLYRELNIQLKEREKVSKALVESEERYKSLVEDQPIFLVRYRTDGTIFFVNEYYAKFLGEAKEDIYANTIYDYVLSSERKSLQKHVQSISDMSLTERVESRVVSGSGETRWVKWVDRAIFDSSQNIVEIQSVGYDITEAKNIKQSLIRAKEEALDLAKIKDEFLAKMSHEIRNPLNIIVGMSDLLQDTDLSVKQCEYVNSIKESSIHLLSIVNDLLDFSIMKADKIPIVNKQFSIREFLNSFVATFSFEVEKKGLNLYCKASKDIPEILFGEESHLRQILHNLVSNAIKFTDKGSIYIKVLSEKVSGVEAILEFIVKDTGIGIPKDKFSLIFNDFSQVRSDLSRKYGGVGLGLPIVRNLVELHDGKIWLESDLGQGSVFHFTFPFRLCENEQSENLKNNRTQTIRKKRCKLRLLVVEDNLLNQKILVSMLKKEKVYVEAVSNAVSALDILDKKHFDMILLDIQMPDIDGFELTRRIRAHSKKHVSNTAIIATTAHALPSEKNKALAFGMDGYLTKPFTAQMLFEQIQTVVNSKKWNCLI